MNEERLCPLCCENMTRGTICTKCSFTQPSLRYMEVGKQWTIRGVPASQARCPQEELMHTELFKPEGDRNQEQIYLLQPSSTEVNFTCRTCGTPCAMRRPSEGCTTNLFCVTCKRQYWVDWQAGVLHMGLDNDQRQHSHIIEDM